LFLVVVNCAAGLVFAAPLLELSLAACRLFLSLVVCFDCLIYTNLLIHQKKNYVLVSGSEDEIALVNSYHVADA
jgi:hypothetical protein